MPLSVACLMTVLSASRSEGLITITLAPAEIKLRMSAICSVGPPLRLATITFDTLPEAFACALIEQIISSRQPLPVSVFETPTTYFVGPVLGWLPPHAARANAPTIKPTSTRACATGHSRFPIRVSSSVRYGPVGPDGYRRRRRPFPSPPVKWRGSLPRDVRTRGKQPRRAPLIAAVRLRSRW